MSQLLNPAIALMNRLRYPQKFLLISLLFIVPLALVMTLLIAEVNTKANFAQKEAYRALSDAALQRSFIFWDRSIGILDDLLQARNDDANQKRTWC